MKPHLEEAWRAIRLADRDVDIATVTAPEVSQWVAKVRMWADREVIGAEKGG